MISCGPFSTTLSEDGKIQQKQIKKCSTQITYGKSSGSFFTHQIVSTQPRNSTRYY